MSLKNQISFSSGELDPILHDRVTLERFQNALHTARNVMVGKTGSIMSRFGRFNFKQSAYANGLPIKIFCPPKSGLLMEFGLDMSFQPYVNLYNFSGTLIHTYITSGLDHLYFSGANLEKLQFVYSGKYVYVFEGTNSASSILRLEIFSPYTVRAASQVIPELFWPGGAISVATTTTSTGYKIDYAFTIVVDGEESEAQEVTNVSVPTLKKCINIAEETSLVIDIIAGGSVPNSYKEIRIYQRPSAGSAYGYLGRTTNFYIDAGRVKAKFVDVGADADFSNGLQTDIVFDTLDSDFTTGIILPGTGAVYQQRLILGNIIGINDEAILASRPGHQTNFYRDFPYSSDSALNFKAGSSGKAKVLRMIEHNGLVVFTDVGVFISSGVLSPDNLILEKRGSWVIDENIPPLVIPGGMFFVDKDTGSIRQLVYSQEISTYDSIDQTIFSSHLFKYRTIKSWSFQDGIAPLVIIAFSDGTFATFTYSYEHQMKAWTRSESVYPVEQVESTGDADLSFFVINKNGQRYIEGTVPRYIPPSVYAVNPEAHMLAYGSFMDSMTVKVDLLNDSLIGVDEFILTPLVVNDWEGDLTLTCGTSGLFTLVGNGAVGTVFRFFNPKDKSKLDLEVISRTNNNSVVVRPSEEFPSTYATDFRLYLTHTSVTGLGYLEDEIVSVMSDGDVISSPYNDSTEDTLSQLIVDLGVLNLPERSAITIVGRPIVADVKTLNITTVEQSPTTLESLTVNKLYVRTFNSRGIFVDNQFPEELENEVNGTSVKDMQSLDNYYVPSNSPIIGNRSKPALSKRMELTLPGSWETGGEMAFRQVDPLHFEIISIIADVEILKRGR